MTDYKMLDEQSWQEFGENLLHERGLGRRQDFLRACLDGKDAFLEQVAGVFGAAVGTDEVDFSHDFCEREFIHPPEDTQQIIWETYQEKPDELLASCEFWGHTIIRMIEQGLIQPLFLASQLNGETKTGAYIVDSALNANSNRKRKIDRCARRILRSMCNPAPRGKRIVFNDFHLGKAYWRWRWADKMAQHIGVERDEILDVLDMSYYASFAAKMHSGKSYIGSVNVLGGLLLYLKERLASESDKLQAKKLERIIDKISYHSVWKAIEMQAPEANREEIRAIADMTVA